MSSKALDFLMATFPLPIRQFIEAAPKSRQHDMATMYKAGFDAGQRELRTDFIYAMGLAELADDIREDCARMIEDAKES